MAGNPFLLTGVGKLHPYRELLMTVSPFELGKTKSTRDVFGCFQISKAPVLKGSMFCGLAFLFASLVQNCDNFLTKFISFVMENTNSKPSTLGYYIRITYLTISLLFYVSLSCFYSICY